MGKALDLVMGFVTAPGAVQTALGMAAGDTLVVRNATEASKNFLLNTWAVNQAAGMARIMSPVMHDRINGYRFDVQVATPDPVIPDGAPQPILKGDTITADLSGSAVGGDIEQMFLLNYYEDSIGYSQNLISAEDVKKRIKQMVTMRNVIVTGAGGGWTGGMAINATEDRFIADVEYAILGYVVNAIGGAVRYRGPDTSNLGVGGICHPAYRDITVNWFMKLSEKLGLPLIPVINSNNKAVTFIEAAQNENAAAITVDTIYALLSK